ncbi:hypothetical protein [Chryseobacterium sp.]|uniref:hypothetical protein n=1 Tax=Chryseobacterium sp. TaxID=1871047 RepID=UPI0023525766|nr:hypothetical protein [Chryseobacterium sp.]
MEDLPLALIGMVTPQHAVERRPAWALECSGARSKNGEQEKATNRYDYWTYHKQSELFYYI